MHLYVYIDNIYKVTKALISKRGGVRTDSLFVCLCLTSLQERGHLETAHPFTVPYEGHEARQIHRESNPGSSRGSPLRYRCATQPPPEQTERGRIIAAVFAATKSFLRAHQMRYRREFYRFFLHC